MSKDLVTLAIVLALGAGIGGILGYGFSGFLLALLLWSLWQIYLVYQLNRCLQLDEDPPDRTFLPPAWDELYARTQNLRHRNVSTSSTQKLYARLLSGLQTVPFGILLLQSNYHIQWFNRHAAELLDLKEQDLGLPVTHLFREPKVGEVLKQQTHTRLELTSANDRACLISVQFLGEGHLLVVEDQTELLQAEQARDHLLDNTSHELRSPLSIIKGYTEMMANKVSTPSLQQPLNEIQTQVVHMENIITGMLELARLGKAPLEKTTLQVISMHDLINDVVEEARKVFGERQPQLEVAGIEVQVDTTLDLYGKYDELRSAFSNLVHNALQFSPPQSLVKLSWYRDESGGHFQVSDQGCGIAAEHIPRITERLYRVNQSSATEGNKTGTGVGLGLAITKHVLRRHHAQLHIQSTLGKGSTFRCDFPADMLHFRDKQV